MTEFKGHASEGRDIGDPRKVAYLFLAIAVLTLGFADYWVYSIAYHRQPDVYQDLLHGTALAPAQYRVGVVLLGNFVARHSHLALRHTLTMIDTASAFIGVFALFFLLRRSNEYHRADSVRRWFAAAAFFGLVEFYFAWVLWYQRPETLPSLALIALTLLLLTMRLPRPASYLATALLMLLLAVLQGFVRADVAFALHIGIFLVCLTKAGEGLSLPRSVQATTSALAVLIAAGIQYYLMYVKYPHASYGNTPVFRLILTLTHPSEWVTFLLFIAPYAWTVLALQKVRRLKHGPEMAMLSGSLVFLGMWLLLGRVWEVRIFLPFALAVAPLTVQMALEQFVPKEITPLPAS
jgi:hypothetical protein